MGLKLLRIFDIDVYVDWSLLIIFFLLASALALGVFPAWHPDWGPALAWTTASAAALLFFASVLVHELSHALVGRRQGAVIRRITLFVFGGVAHVEREPQKWRGELWMAAVGPLTSLLLGFAFLMLAGTLISPDAVDLDRPEEVLRALDPVPTLLFWVGQVNIVLALFNLVPAFPLDGGRVLRAMLWAASGNLRQATRLASRLGQGFAWLLIATGFAMMLGFRVPLFGAGVLGGLWLAFIGWFLNNAALMSYRQLLTREALEGVPVSRLMQTRFDTVRPDMTIEDLIGQHLLRSGQRAFPVVADDRLQGIVCLSDVTRIESGQRATTTVAHAMTPIERLVTVTADEDAHGALSLFAERGLNQLPVVEDGRIRGLLRREEIVSWLALHEQPASAALSMREQRSSGRST